MIYINLNPSRLSKISISPINYFCFLHVKQLPQLLPNSVKSPSSLPLLPLMPFSNPALCSPSIPPRSHLYQFFLSQSSFSSSPMSLPPLPRTLNPKFDRWIGSSPASSASPASCSCNLDMCTETLGFENGAMCFDCESGTGAERKKGSPQKQGRSAAPEFPPPLTTLRGQGKMLLRRKKEKGRVLLIGFRPLVVEAERSGGRLVLRMPARGGLKKTGEEEEEDEEEEEEGRGEKEESVLRYGCRGKCRSVNGIFGSDALWLAT